jgi:plastocyanin
MFCRLALFASLFAAGAGAAHAETHVVDINGFAYSPSAVTVQVGDYVTIAATPVHPLRFQNNPDVLCTSACTFLIERADSPLLFYCQNHGAGGMTGGINVQVNDDVLFVNGMDVPLELTEL